MVAIETYGTAKQTWLETFLALPKGIPSHDTFSRVLGLLDPQQLHSCFLQWVNQIGTTLEINLIHIDGKTARGADDRESKLNSSSGKALSLAFSYQETPEAGLQIRKLRTKRLRLGRWLRLRVFYRDSHTYCNPFNLQGNLSSVFGVAAYHSSETNVTSGF